jgi:hypothetical protein
MPRLRVLGRGAGTDPGSGARSMAVAAPVTALTRVRAAIAVVAREPSLWALGALSFSIRGGWLLLAVPIITFPEEGQLSTILGPLLTTSGPNSALGVLLAVAGLLAIGIAGLVIVLASYAEVSVFDRAVHRPETLDLRAGRSPGEPGGPGRRSLVLRLAFLDVLGLVVILGVAGVVGRNIPKIATAELQFPTSTDSLVARVIGEVRGELLVLAAVTVLADAVLAVLSRRLLVRRFGLAGGGRSSLGAAGRGLVWMAMTAVACWAVTVAVLVPVLWVTGFTWTAVRDLFLAPGLPSAPDVTRQMLTLVGFVATWIGGLALAGLASALRAALWTTSSLR